MAMRSDGPSPARHLIHDGKDLVMMLAVGLFLVAGVGTWFWGEAAGLLAHGVLPHVALSQSLSIVTHLPGCLKDPRLAWPAETAIALPGPVLFYCAGSLLSSVCVGLTVVGTRIWLRF